MTDETSDTPFSGGLDGLDEVEMTLPDADPIADPQATIPADDPLLTGDLDPEELNAMAEAQRAMEDARARLADVPAEVVVTNHVMGLYELAAIHLSANPPDLAQAALAVDAVGCLVDGLGDRLGPDAPTMQDALNNIRMAFVQIKGSD